MKKLISIFLVCSMLILSSLTIFATNNEPEAYDLAELFTDYHEYSLSEMVEFINANPQAILLVEYFRDYLYSNYHWMVIHMSGEYDRNARVEVWNDFVETGVIAANCAKYLMWSGSRPQTPDSYISSYYAILMGEKGNICVEVEIKEEFVIYINSLDQVEGNRMILNFLMNLTGGNCVGVSWNLSNYLIPGDKTYSSNCYSNVPIITGDCNRDGAINGADGYLIKKAILGFDNGIDPFAVDMNEDGQINAKDSLALKKKIVMGN